MRAGSPISGVVPVVSALSNGLLYALLSSLSSFVPQEKSIGTDEGSTI